ncbi:hypothetical protein DPMN_014273 [Dreissena polymorpha]|uniref:Uncharacterized protein n=1 Tax=Dreissena polymorpha TaxID=45954 RepID=A0A9D4N9B2_DREPO|nr:hypothetical protein DPMN_014273 [Dreissena polymorpha]
MDHSLTKRMLRDSKPESDVIVASAQTGVGTLNPFANKASAQTGSQTSDPYLTWQVLRHELKPRNKLLTGILITPVLDPVHTVVRVKGKG